MFTPASPIKINLHYEAIMVTQAICHLNNNLKDRPFQVTLSPLVLACLLWNTASAATQAFCKTFQTLHE